MCVDIYIEKSRRAGSLPLTNPKSSGAPSFAPLRRVGCKPLAPPGAPHLASEMWASRACATGVPGELARWGGRPLPREWATPRQPTPNSCRRRDTKKNVLTNRAQSVRLTKLCPFTVDQISITQLTIRFELWSLNMSDGTLPPAPPPPPAPPSPLPPQAAATGVRKSHLGLGIGVALVLFLLFRMFSGSSSSSSTGGGWPTLHPPQKLGCPILRAFAKGGM